MSNSAVARLAALTIAGVLYGSAAVDGAAAQSVIYRFEAERSRIPIAPPEGTVAALVAATPRLSGTFGFEPHTPLASAAGIPDRVSFAGYETGFITVDGLDLGRVPGVVEIQVTDGMTQTDDPRLTIDDEISLSTRAVSTATPLDALTLSLRYADAERLHGVELPATLNLDDIAKMHLTFSTRLDTLGDRAQRQTGDTELLGLVHFDITGIERVE